ncbi:hypothetical protein AAU61_13670 [Desulfocarbo indianensis]|nr:hypothetical protein AAU61_13670 [Desulfocarbo indianensis]
MGLVIFTDLDGTLLDHHDYSIEAALPALEEIRARRVPLILCSSKTRAEMYPLWHSLSLREPFITENGGGIYLPKEHLLAGEPGWKPAGAGWRMRALGLPINEVRARFAGFKGRFGARGFGDLGDQEVAELTGLSLPKAGLARQREFNEPALLARPEEDAEAFTQAAQAAGLQVTRGGRFFHLLAGGDKGKAVRELSQLYRAYDPELKVMALGDAPNDLPMLAAADRAVLVARPGGGHASLDLPGLIREPGVGPQGWNAAVLQALQELA